jgi:hypothetical protein
VIAMTDERKDSDNSGVLLKDKSTPPRVRVGTRWFGELTGSLATRSHPRANRIIVYQHSDLLYWWIVWAYGLICAGLTRIQGIQIKPEKEGPDIFVHPRAWVGISFVCVIIFVLVFTNARARGLRSLVLLLFIALVAGVLEQAGGLGLVSEWFKLMKVHMNLAFYLFFSVTLLFFWVLSIFIFDRLDYVYFTPGKVGRKDVMSEGGENFLALQLQTSRRSDDLFVHRILGLWFLGFGTGDLDVRFATPGGGEKHYELKNVWRIRHVEGVIHRLMGAQEQLAGAPEKSARAQE